MTKATSPDWSWWPCTEIAYAKSSPRVRHHTSADLDQTELMARQQQEALPDVPPPRRTRVWCRGCRRELTDGISRMRGWGAECDPDPRHETARFDIDQDALPGL